MILKRYESIEILIPPASTLVRYYFPDQAQLRNANINSLQFIGFPPLSPNSNSPNIVATDVQQAFLTLYSGDVQLVLNMPLSLLNNINQAQSAALPSNSLFYVHNIPDVAGLVISWTKSFVSFAVAPTSQAYQQAISFGVYYTLPGGTV